MTQKGNAGSSVAVSLAYTAHVVCNCVWLASLPGEREKQLLFLLRRGTGEEPVKATCFPLQELTPGQGWVA